MSYFIVDAVCNIVNRNRIARIESLVLDTFCRQVRFVVRGCLPRQSGSASYCRLTAGSDSQIKNVLDWTFAWLNIRAIDS